MINKQPYIVINGVNSQSLPGLLIQQLPPITKPLMRATIEQIDGRDGDIITPLGYAAYDKQFKIGLSRGFSIDDIVKFFNQSGRVIFSNEPEKYYNFTLLNQIDFTRLLRFKEATVTLHVQPFKFAVLENTKTFSFDGSTEKEFYIRNNGNYYSKPTIAVKGTGNVYLSLNGVQILGLEFTAANPEIIISAADMNAYAPDGKLLNRSVSGDYDNIKFEVGENKISFTGSVQEIKITNFSRWL